MIDDSYFMEMALSLAAKGAGFTSPNPLVGAVVVKDGKVVGKGYHHAAGEAHAEVNAIEEAGSMAKDADLYVTLEPCNHFGRTPPCSEKILSAGIKRVFCATKDPNPEVKGGGIKYLNNKGIDVIVGLCEEKAKKLNEIFIKYVTTKIPFVILKCATTLDGYIATKTGDSKWVSGQESRAFVHRLRHLVDAIMVGAGTIKKDNPYLTTRVEGLKGKDPIRIVLDNDLSIQEDANIFSSDSEAGTLIITKDFISHEKKVKFAIKDKVRIIEMPLKSDGQMDLKYLINYLGSCGITSILIEGGSHLIGTALYSKIVDKVYFFYAPKLLGSDDGVPICRGVGPEKMENSIAVKNIDLKRFGNDFMVEGYL